MQADKRRIPASILALFLLGATLALAPALHAEDNWPQFRGPGSSGVSKGQGMPQTWSDTENVLWKVKIPGRGWSSPIVWGDRIFVTSAVQEEGEPEKVKQGLYLGGERPNVQTPQRWMVYCLDWNTGKVVWEQLAHRGVPEFGHHLKNTFASETPLVDGNRVYAYFGNVGVFSYDMEGKLLWSKNLGAFPTRFNWGTAASPVLHENRIYIVNDNQRQSFLVALDAETGEEIWRTDRDEKSNWSTPLVWQNPLRTEIITPGSRKTRSYDLSGKLLWELGGASSITVPTPLAYGDLLYVASGYVGDRRKPLFAIRPGASGDISLSEEETSNQYIAWCQKKAAPYNPSPIVYEDLLYVLYDRGQIACFDAKTGEGIYERQQIDAEARAYTASPWAYEDKIFCLSEDGDTFVIQAGKEYKLVGRNRLGEMCLATPAIARKSLILRTESSLLRIERK